MRRREAEADSIVHVQPHTYRCPAKVNLALSVGGPRADGYHPIASWMVAVSLCDDLTVERLPDGHESGFEIGWADDAPCPSAIDWALDDDLAVRAHGLMQEHTSRPLPVRAGLTKRIPVGAGLAGGSSNGATMLQALNEQFDLGIDHDTQVELAMRLGSDLAFFMGGPSAIVTGRGEHLQPAPHATPIHLALLLSNLHCATGAVYRAFDAMHPEATVDTKRVTEFAAAGALTDDGPFNDLADPACAVEPRLGTLRDRCAVTSGRTVHITGSGAGMFIVARDADDSESLSHQMRGVPDIVALTVQSLV